MKEGYFIKHLRKFKKILSKKNQLLIDSFKKCNCPNIKLLGTSTGFHIVLFLDNHIDIDKMLTLSRKKNIPIKKIENLNSENLIIFYYSKFDNDKLDSVVKSLVENINFSYKL